MPSPRSSSWRLASVLLISALLACSPPSVLDLGTLDAAQWFDVSLPVLTVPDGFVITEVTSDGGSTAVDPSVACRVTDVVDAGSDVDATVFTDAGDASLDADDGSLESSACASPLGPGDLVFDEAMISSEPGSSDRGQWLEVRSTQPCSLDLLGLHASAPHGQSARTVDVTSDLWLPAGGFFLIADTLDPTENNGLPGLVLAWAGSPADVLHKTSDTITLSVGTVMIDTLTYPDKKRAQGISMAFPSSCSAALRGEFSSWVPSVASWTSGFSGTPGAPNTDVMCAVTPIPTCTDARRVRRKS